MKTKKPTSVRFEEDHLQFIQEKEKLETKQDVVDFLLNAYWEMYHPRKPVFMPPELPDTGGKERKTEKPLIKEDKPAQKESKAKTSTKPVSDYLQSRMNSKLGINKTIKQ
jgi:hypothetical protein